MDYRFKFVADKRIKDKAYPALARHKAQPYTQAWREFGRHWPCTVPVELHEHCANHQVGFDIYEVGEDWPNDSFYTIGLGFFDFSIDYIGLLPGMVKQQLKSRRLHLLFYYHEGDNPYNIKSRLDDLCHWHHLPTDCYRFISGNTQARSIGNFIWFPDHELLYWHRNREIPATPIHQQPRPYRFTVLNRTHKWWRASVMADLWRSGMLNDSQWSYRTDIECGDRPEDNPIEIDSIENLRSDLDKFLLTCPHSCDDLTVEEQNDHHLLYAPHYQSSWCSIILETHFDADGSQGAFLTEKIFRAIKHGHPFVVIGCPGTLSALQDLGYKTFDHAIDNAYDRELDNTKRYLMARSSIQQLATQHMPTWFELVRSDVEHNQQLFLQTKAHRLNRLFEQLHKK